MKNQLLNTDKFKALGAFAGGVAHDFNNILMTIMMNMEFVLKKLEPDDPLRENLEMSLKAASTAKDLSEQLVVFSCSDEAQGNRLSAYPVINEAVKRLRSKLPKSIDIDQNLNARHSKIIAHPLHLQQILDNLCCTASDEMHETGGVLFVGLAETVFSAEDTPVPTEIKAKARYLNLTVAIKKHGEDTSDILIKSPPQNPNCLSVTETIVQEIGGTMRIDAPSNEMKTVEVFIPIAEDTQAVFKAPPPPSPAPSQNATILVVDDEDLLIQSLIKPLGHYGFQVEGETSCSQALKNFKLNPDHFDLVITDHAMPEMTGIQFTQKILAIRPDIPVILCTGFIEDGTHEAADKIGIKKVLTKPVNTKELADVITAGLKHPQK